MRKVTCSLAFVCTVAAAAFLGACNKSESCCSDNKDKAAVQTDAQSTPAACSSLLGQVLLAPAPARARRRPARSPARRPTDLECQTTTRPVGGFCARRVVVVSAASLHSPPMLDALNQLESRGLESLAGAKDGAALEAWRVEYLGNSGKVKAALGGLKDVPKDQKPAVGAKANQVRVALEEAFKQRQEAMSGAAGGGLVSPAKAGEVRLDMTEPGLHYSTGLGRRHIISRVRDETLVEVFARMGFAVAQGPELEDDEHNFVKLNIPHQHPARDPIDNYYIDDPARFDVPRMLRSQTSTVQVRVMETQRPPLKIVSPGRVYRPDTVDATHSFMFHQIEGLYIDRNVSMADLKTCLLQFARAYFGVEAQVRLRPSYFPFTEPSAEVDMFIRLRADQPARWIELGGCGMVDPAVLTMCNIDPEQWSGFAFGFGIERLAMGKYAIPDIRMLFENDLRFLKQL